MIVWSGFGWVVMACVVAGVLIVNGFFLLFGVTKGMPLHHDESGVSALAAVSWAKRGSRMDHGGLVLKAHEMAKQGAWSRR